MITGFWAFFSTLPEFILTIWKYCGFWEEIPAQWQQSSFLTHLAWCLCSISGLKSIYLFHFHAVFRARKRHSRRAHASRFMSTFVHFCVWKIGYELRESCVRDESVQAIGHVLHWILHMQIISLSVEVAITANVYDMTHTHSHTTHGAHAASPPASNQQEIHNGTRKRSRSAFSCSIRGDISRRDVMIGANRAKHFITASFKFQCIWRIGANWMWTFFPVSHLLFFFAFF